MPAAGKSLAVLWCLVFLALPTAAAAAIFEVTSEAELTAALATAAANNEDNTIAIQAGTYHLTQTARFETGQSNHSLVIQGQGGKAILDGGGTYRVMLLRSFASGTSITLRDLVLQNGYISPNVGGLYADFMGSNTQIVVTDCSFLNNKAVVAWGGGVLLDATRIQVSRSIFSGNGLASGSMALYGAGLLLSTSAQGYASVDNCLFVGNDGGAAGYGGGLYVEVSGPVQLTNNTFVNNAGLQGGGVYLFMLSAAWAPELYNNLFWGNTATAPDSDDIYARANVAGPYPDVILWNNLVAAYSGDAAISFNPQDNLNEDPLLDGSYLPTAGSPCRDAGYNSAVADLLLDLEMTPRVQNEVVDIGAREYPTPGMVLAPASLSPAAPLGQNPAPQALQVGNQGALGFDFTASSDASWLRLDPASGTVTPGGSQTVTVTYDTASLAPGSYFALITVADLTPVYFRTRQIAVSLTVSTGDLALTPDGLHPAATLGGNPAPQTFLVRNLGGAPLNFTAGSNAAWLRLDPASGTVAPGGSQTVTVTYDTAGLAPGTHAALITVADPTPTYGRTGQVAVDLALGAGSLVGMRRACNPVTGRHVFSLSAREIAALTALGWRDESSPMPFYVTTTNLPGSRPVHRLYNPFSGEHYLTLKNGERDFLVSLGWLAERDQGRMFPAAAPGASEVLTLYHPVLGEHFYTTSSEGAWILANLALWSQQSSLGWAFRPQPN
ncbi:MAG: right-handed parallel beta-helix repeat-containing protein [Deltaproteobacteria bacterium]|nr:right-handed parallel beta-helix repeat-containing protein [Deltaproteobacteria bacterium]